jgi:hypothetical protein
MTREEFHRLCEESKERLAKMTPEELEDLRENGCNAACPNGEEDTELD